MNLRILLLLLLLAATIPAHADDFLTAPSEQELDRKANAYVRNRRVVAIVLITGTLVAGLGGSIVRRRARKAAQQASATRGLPELDPASLLDLPSTHRADSLRKALRSGSLDRNVVERDLDAWVEVYEGDGQPQVRVLVLEALAASDDGRVEALRRRAAEDAADSVRLEALHQLLQRHPDERESLGRRALDDPGVEVCVLGAETLVDIDPDVCARAVLRMIASEALAPRESHALRRGLGFLVEDLGDPRWCDSIEALREECEDVESTIDWALDELEKRRSQGE